MSCLYFLYIQIRLVPCPTPTKEFAFLCRLTGTQGGLTLLRLKGGSENESHSLHREYQQFKREEGDHGEIGPQNLGSSPGDGGVSLCLGGSKDLHRNQHGRKCHAGRLLAVCRA